MEHEDLADLLILQKEVILPPQRQVVLLILSLLVNVQSKNLHEAVAREHRHQGVLLVFEFDEDVEVQQGLAFIGVGGHLAQHVLALGCLVWLVPQQPDHHPLGLVLLLQPLEQVPNGLLAWSH